MRKPRPVLERIQDHLEVPILGDLTEDARDAHWIWLGRLPDKITKQVFTLNRTVTVRTAMQVPPRIRDEDGKIKSVSRILFKAFRGFDLEHVPRRAAGCDYTCVNPFHYVIPSNLLPDKEIDAEEFDDIEGLADEVRDFIAAHGRDEHAIRDRFGLDYTDDEITQALRKIET